MPEASLRINPARIINWWLMISASEGVSLRVAMVYLEDLMSFTSFVSVCVSVSNVLRFGYVSSSHHDS